MSHGVNFRENSSSYFHYQLLPSAFKIAEAPTYLCWKLLRSSEFLWNQQASNDWEQMKNRTFAVLAAVGGYIGGWIALPITLCLTPVTLLADIAIGILECIYCFFHGVSKIIFTKPLLTL